MRAELAARTSYGRLLALVAAGTHDIAGAEDALADAFERALRTWPVDGVPDRPDAWLLTVARNRQRDRWRSAEATRTTALDPDAHAPVHLDDVDPDAVPDRRLELMLVCAHPAIAVGDRTPLMLNTVLGFTAEQVARSYAVPDDARWRPGWCAPSTASVTTGSRSGSPTARTCRSGWMPCSPPCTRPTSSSGRPAPASVTCPPRRCTWPRCSPSSCPTTPRCTVWPPSSSSRPPAARRRLAPDGRFVPLASQDTALWDADLIARAHDHLRAAHPARVVGRYQLEAAVQAVHCARRETGRTDWPTLLELHRSLAVVAPSLGSATALAAVTAEVEGPAAGLALLDADAGRTARFQPAWATRAELLTRLGRDVDAAAAYDHAIALTHETPERRHLEARRAALRG